MKSIRKLWGVLFLAVSATMGWADEPAASFRNDILPILTRAGCNAGSCHGKADGQNGFALSIFSYDPVSDHQQIVASARGRRIFPAVPEMSLLLQKATGSVPHKGGMRFEVGSREFRTLAAWIRNGAPFAISGEPTLERIAVSPGSSQGEKGEKLELRVVAHFSDQSTRDVTGLSEYSSHDKEFVTVDEHGQVTVGRQSGEGVVVVRYMGQVGLARVAIPPEKLLPESVYADLPVRNFIDQHLYDRHKTLGLKASGPINDATFLRRASLDTIGRLPVPDEVRTFLADKTPDKRAALVESLLADPAWADYWATKWSDMLRPNTQRVGVKPTYLLDRWLRRQFQANRPYDEIVRELLTAKGSTHEYGPAVIFRDKRTPADAGAFASRIFLGIRLDCAQCHHHPSEKWGQEDYYQFAAFFSSVGRKGQGISAPISGLPEFIFHKPGGVVTHPVTEATMKPTALDGLVPEILENRDPREALMDWMVGPENPFFARTVVNRVWGEFFGRGIVNPVDDFRASNPPANEPLLTALAADFVKSGYDLKHLMRAILTSHAYGISSIPNDTNAADLRHFSRSYRRRLPAEVMLDAVCDVTGVPHTFEGLPPGARAVHTWNAKMGSTFLDTFGRPDASAECPCDREETPSVTQALHMMNAEQVLEKIGASNGVVQALAKSEKMPEAIIDDLYLRLFARFPAVEEKQLARSYFEQEGKPRAEAVEDLMWALLNSAEFVFNH